MVVIVRYSVGFYTKVWHGFSILIRTDWGKRESLKIKMFLKILSGFPFPPPPPPPTPPPPPPPPPTPPHLPFLKHSGALNAFQCQPRKAL